MTDKQCEVVRAIAQLSAELGRPPQLREVMDRLGYHYINALNTHLTPLRRDGWVETIQKGRRMVGVRLCGLEHVAVYKDDEAGRRLESLLVKKEAKSVDQ